MILGGARQPDTGPLDLRERRRVLGLSTREVAGAVGADPMSVLRWERRERFPAPDVIVALAAALDVPTAAVVRFFDAARPASSTSTSVRGPGLRALRRARGVGVRDLARAAGVPASTVYNWEACRVRIPTDAVPRLAARMGLPAAVFLAALARPPVSIPVPAVPARSLRSLRLRRGCTQQGLADLVGASRWSVRAWENGATPPLHAVRRLAQVHGLGVAEMAALVGLRPPPQLSRQNWGPGQLAEVLCALRAWSGLSQRELAAACGCSVTTVRAWEHSRNRPCPALRARVETCYGLEPGALQVAYDTSR